MYGGYTQINFSNLNDDQKDLLIARLSEIGFTGFEEDAGLLKAFIPGEDFDESSLNKIAASHKLTFSRSTIPETNWNQVWESNFEPVIIEDFVAIRADFHRSVKSAKYEIVVTPKMSFGTGHHATTAMMMREMKEIEFTGKTVLDFGTGTGILAILAEKLGAKAVIAIDNDPWSIANASENFQHNNCIKTKLVQTSSLPETRFDIILANINKSVIIENLFSLSHVLSADGTLLVSGLLDEDEFEVLREAGKFSLIPGRTTEQDHWICIRFAH